MSRLKMIAGMFICMLMMLTLLGCASTPTSSSTGEFIDDSVITAKVKALIAQDEGLKVFQIGVETYKGVVQLSGFVDSRKTADHAEKIARGVPGVVAVKNNLVLKH